MRHFKEYAEKLRFSDLRPTKQRLMISQILFDQKETFHFTIESLNKTKLLDVLFYPNKLLQ